MKSFLVRVFFYVTIFCSFLIPELFFAESSIVRVVFNTDSLVGQFAFLLSSIMPLKRFSIAVSPLGT